MNKALAFGSIIKRPYTTLELARMSGIPPEEFFDFIKIFEEKTNSAKEERGFFSYAHEIQIYKTRRRQDNIRDEMFMSLQKIIHIFSFIPFIRGVWISGSLAVGNVREDSDIDILVATEEGRLYTTRFLIIGLMKILGKKRNGNTPKETHQKLCFNHFVDTKHLKLQESSNAYLEIAYKNFIPVYGERETIEQFKKQNTEWAGNYINARNRLYVNKKQNMWERVFSGTLGKTIEFILKKIQIRHTKKISKSLQNQIASRVICEDGEVETQYNISKTKDILELLTF